MTHQRCNSYREILFTFMLELPFCVYVYMIFRRYYSNRQVMIDSEAPLHVFKATEPPAVKIREINLRSCRRESNPRRRRDERASNPLGHRGSSLMTQSHTSSLISHRIIMQKLEK